MHRLEVLSRQLTSGARLPSSPTATSVATREEYERLYKWSIEQPEEFWLSMASEYYWHRMPEQKHISYNTDMRAGPVHVSFFKGGLTNLSYNCLDRWVTAGRGSQPCFIFEGNDLGHERVVTYREALDQVCRVANWLRSQGVRKGDAVTLYMPHMPELPICMLACARIGAVHSVVFAGFSAESLAQRIMDCQAKVVITASAVMRGTKAVPLKELVDTALDMVEREQAKEGRIAPHMPPLPVLAPRNPGSSTHPQRGARTHADLSLGPVSGAVGAAADTSLRVLVFGKSALPREATPMRPGRDVWWNEVIPSRPAYCSPEWLDPEDRSFLLYTSGSTGKPKGVVHTTGGYMVGVGTTMRMLFNVQPGDVYWCTADCGWITGHSYVAYGPLLCGATCVLFGSTPAHPNPGRCWRVIEKYKVKQFYTAPTLLRALLTHGDQWPQAYDLSSLQVLGSVGEPINEAAWRWLKDVIGRGRCPIVDTWWQTETGMVLMSPWPAAWSQQKPGSAETPFLGVRPVLLDPTTGAELPPGPGEGVLCLKGVWPSMARTLHGDHGRFMDTYFAPFKGYYFTGDGCRRDEQGAYWITGRVDDVINVSGHRIGTAEVEGALTEHHDCAEAAVIGIDHPVKGQAIYAYVTLCDGAPASEATRRILLDHVRKAIGPFAAPDVIHWAPGLPKTRSGKIMRRVLRKIAAGQEKELGDLSTLAEPQVVEQLLAHRGK